EEGFPYHCRGAGTITLNPGVNEFDFSKVLLQAGDLPGGQAAGQDGIVNAFDVSLVLNMLKNGLSRQINDIAV
ncbi:hypothetical protein, partial [Escherichia coli]|uniref:hypothetical protein n=1 Tax=Escherichia coli TaxID=562 RepID=UPI00256EEB8D